MKSATRFVFLGLAAGTFGFLLAGLAGSVYSEEDIAGGVLVAAVETPAEVVTDEPVPAEEAAPATSEQVAPAATRTDTEPVAPIRRKPRAQASSGKDFKDFKDYKDIEPIAEGEELPPRGISPPAFIPHIRIPPRAEAPPLPPEELMTPNP